MIDKSLRSRLGRLFSSSVVVRRIGKNRIKVIDSNRLQSSGNYNQAKKIDRYGRIHGTRTNIHSYNQQYNYHSSRLELYHDYETMDRDSYLSNALDIYADECTVRNEKGQLIDIKSEDENVKKILENLFYDIINVDFNLHPWIRNMCKYGDFFLYLDIEEGIGIKSVMPMSTYEIIREELTDPRYPYTVKFYIENDNMAHRYHKAEFESFEIAHFRLMNDTNFLPYGKSILEGCRKVWKQLTLMEDAMLIHRIMRAPERRIFKIDIGNIPPNEVDNYMEQIISQMKKVPYVDQQTGEYNLKFNLMNMIEDYWLPTRGGDSQTSIDTLNGLTWNGIEDIEYLRNRMLAGLKIPAAYLGYGDGNGQKATLAAEDVNFARAIEQMQRIVESELTKIAIIHLYAQGYEDEELVNFELKLTNPSIIYEQEKTNLWKERMDLADQIHEGRLLPDKWIYENLFNMSKEEWEQHQLDLIADTKFKFRLTQIEEEGNDPAITGESFGTAHDIAAMHVAPGEDKDGDGMPDPLPTEPGAPEGGQPGAGRPDEGTAYGSQDHVRGRDPLGKQAMKRFSSENIDFINRYRTHKKQIITETFKPNSDSDIQGSFLDESQLLKDE